VRYIINSCHRFRVIDRATTLPRLRFGGSNMSLITGDSDRPIVRGRGRGPIHTVVYQVVGYYVTSECASCGIL